MNIEEFVRETLKQISAAVVSVEDTSKRQCVQPEIPVHFDLAVATTEETFGGAGGGIQVASIVKIGADRKKQKGVEEYSRVNFDLVFHVPSKSYHPM